MTSQLPAPSYSPNSSAIKAMLAVESMKRHMTDEGWQLALSLQKNGYTLCGNNLTVNKTNVQEIVEGVNPGTLFVQDKREWDPANVDFREKNDCFHNIQYLRSRPDIFKVTVLKDVHQRPLYHAQSAEEMGCHAWVVYYNPHHVLATAPYLRPQHIIRTYHTIDPAIVPKLNKQRLDMALLSGAVSRTHYPLRHWMVQNLAYLPNVHYLKHPGYHKDGCVVSGFLNTLNSFKVAICTASHYDYALRKFMEATACGCIVLTNYTHLDPLPEIDENLVRLPPQITAKELNNLIAALCKTYDPERQAHYAQKALAFYNYHSMGERLAQDIENLRQSYNSPV